MSHRCVRASLVGQCSDDPTFSSGGFDCAGHRPAFNDATGTYDTFCGEAATRAACPLSCGVCSVRPPRALHSSVSAVCDPSRALRSSVWTGLVHSRAVTNAAQGEFRLPTCGFDATFTFAACCATEGFEAGGSTCEFETTTYANCCTDLTPKFWCGDDPTFTDGAGFTCAEWAAGEFSCVDDTATYSEGDRSALQAACAASCGLCQEWQGEAVCWSAEFSHASCCTGDGDEDGSLGDERCWTAEHNFDTCRCVEPTEPAAGCDADQVMLKPGATLGSTAEADYFVLGATACNAGPLTPGMPGYTVPVHGLCVWEELWGNGYCDSADNSPAGPSYDPYAALWYDQWKADLNCEAAGFGAPLLLASAHNHARVELFAEYCDNAFACL